MPRNFSFIIAASLAVAPATVSAQPVAEPDSEDGDAYEINVFAPRGYRGTTTGREATTVTRRDMELRLPRSTPDALRFEPGVYVQQTAHGQGSAYVRGRTGQQTVLLFDGIRLNNSTFRQGPNQYFFTVDSRTVAAVEAVRGGASTLYGTDAIGGVLSARPIEPPDDPSADGAVFAPRLMARAATADGEYGGRAQLGLQYGPHWGFIGGTGYRRAGLLESGGSIEGPTGEPPLVPRFEEDGRTQRGTGFSELASDARLVYRLGGGRELTAAVYDYRQFDAPRSDQCPPAYAPRGECLTYAGQFRTLGYLSLRGDLGAWARESQIALSYSLQHERRERSRPLSLIENGGRDDVHTLGVFARLETAPAPLGAATRLTLRYGADFYHDRVASQAWTALTDAGVTVHASRGQYLDGSTYSWGGAFLEPSARVFDALTLRAGGRFTGIMARAPGDQESGTAPIGMNFTSGVWNTGIAWDILPALRLAATIDRSFRAPNLDDLTSRQQTGPGFQFENPALTPETATTYEAGLQLTTPWAESDVWWYRSHLHGAIERAPREVSQCPQAAPQCATSWNRFQLVNLRGDAVIWGTEGIVRVHLPWRVTLRGTAAYAFGEGPNPQDRGAGARTYQANVPLSRIPPLNGTAEVLWRHGSGFYAGAGGRFAAAQTRLSLGDQSDARIPQGGTPGYAVVDLRGGYKPSERFLIAVVFENVGDAAYRYHGSSINGPGRGLILAVEGGL